MSNYVNVSVLNYQRNVRILSTSQAHEYEIGKLYLGGAHQKSCPFGSTTYTISLLPTEVFT